MMTSNGWRNAPRSLTAKDFEKAKGILEGIDLGRAYTIYEARPMEGYEKWEERTITDIVGKLARYHNISEKQENFLKGLIEKIDTREQRQAEWKAKREEELANAEDCPTGRITIIGTIVKLGTKSNGWGSREVMTVKAEEGFLVWGTCPSELYDKERGDTVVFKATVTPSENDPKFGFFKRPAVAVTA
jgi:hypothetical protein